MKQTIEFAFRVNERVRISDLKVFGFVEVVRSFGLRNEYYVSYFCDGKRCSEWLHEQELAET